MKLNELVLVLEAEFFETKDDTLRPLRPPCFGSCLGFAAVAEAEDEDEDEAEDEAEAETEAEAVDEDEDKDDGAASGFTSTVPPTGSAFTFVPTPRSTAPSKSLSTSQICVASSPSG